MWMSPCIPRTSRGAGLRSEGCVACCCRQWWALPSGDRPWPGNAGSEIVRVIGERVRPRLDHVPRLRVLALDVVLQFGRLDPPLTTATHLNRGQFAATHQCVG